MIFAKYCKNHQTPHDYLGQCIMRFHIIKKWWSYHTEWGQIEFESTNLDFENFSSTFTHCEHKMYRIHSINHGTPNCDRDWSATWVTRGTCTWDTCTHVYKRSTSVLIQSVGLTHVQVQSCFCNCCVSEQQWLQQKCAQTRNAHVIG